MSEAQETPRELEGLLADSDWLRRLAGGLARDPDTADDLAQETWLAALRKSPPEGEGGLRAWLATVLRNFARRERRDAGLRALHEPRGARDESIQGPDAIAARVELQRELAEALLALEEPYRSVIVLRYFDGLSAKEAAARLGISNESARQRLSRGLGKLRLRLDREHGSRGAWLAVLGPLAPDPAAILKLTALPGGLLAVGTPMKVLALGIAAALAVTIWLWPPIDSPADSVSSAVPGAPDRSALETPDSGAPASGSNLASREVVAAGLPRPAKAQGTTADASEITGEVFDSLEATVADAQVRAVVRGDSGFQLLDTGAASRSHDVAKTRTDAEGRFRLAVPPDRLVQVEIDAGDRGLCALGDRHGGEHVIAHVLLPASVHGRVSSSKDGQPIACASVQASLSRPDRGEEDRAFVRLERNAIADAQGAYSIAGLPPGRYEIRSSPSGPALAHGRTLDLEAGEAASCDLNLGEPVVIRGTVRDVNSKAAIEGAEVSLSWTFSDPVRTDAAGHYELQGPSEVVSEVNARAAGYGLLERQIAEPVPNRLDSFDFELAPGRRCMGSVRSQSGQPLQGAYVAAVAIEYEEFQTIDWRSTESEANGSFEIGDLRPDMLHSIFVRKPGFGFVVYEFPPSEIERSVVDLGEIRLAPELEIAGCVQLDHGAPLSGIKLELRGTNADRARWNSLERTFLDLYVAVRETRTDQAGRFHFGELSAGQYVIDVVPAGFDQPIRQKVSLEEGHAALDVRVVVPAGLTISGVIQDSEGKGVPHTYVSIQAEDGSEVGMDVRTDPNGHFEAHGVPPGAYTLCIWPGAAVREHQADRYLMPRTVQHIQAGREDLSIVLEQGAWLRGQVLEADGSEAQAIFVEVRDGAGASVAQGTFPSGAHFELGVPRGSSLTLTVRRGLPGSPPAHDLEPDPDPAHAAVVAGVMGGTPAIVVRLPAR
ncbi:MAG TPA: sigma-70 family RNA polymerase sigma factor [Planctomycetota bacterium]|nr:sigma-70 family RNA polymerase sigma factor [Planctomycetota bacterium]